MSGRPAEYQSSCLSTNVVHIDLARLAQRVCSFAADSDFPKAIEFPHPILSTFTNIDDARLKKQRRVCGSLRYQPNEELAAKGNMSFQARLERARTLLERLN